MVVINGRRRAGSGESVREQRVESEEVHAVSGLPSPPLIFHNAISAHDLDVTQDDLDFRSRVLQDSNVSQPIVYESSILYETSTALSFAAFLLAFAFSSFITFAFCADSPHAD